MKSLTTREIDNILKNNNVTKIKFLGTFPACVYPISNLDEFCFITNTDNHDDSGEHWNGWFVKKNKVTFFDSFGRPPDDPIFPKDYIDITKKFDSVEYSKPRIQGWTAKSCGYFCVHFIYVFSLGLDFKSFFDDYCNNYEINDMLVYDIVDSIS